MNVQGIWITETFLKWELTLPTEFYTWFLEDQNRNDAMYKINHHHTLVII